MTLLKEQQMSILEKYLNKTPKESQNVAAIAYLAALDHLASENKPVADAIIGELKDQRSFMKLIASENYSSLATQLAMGNLLTDKYSEGVIGKRFYAGCQHVDDVESLAADELKKIFNCDHAYVQPHSGADANLIAFWAVLTQRIQNKEIEKLGQKNVNTLTPEDHEKIRQVLINQKIMGMSLNSGGHLTHGYRMNVSSKMFQAYSYDVNPETELIDYDDLAKKVREVKPFIFIAGYSAYPRLLDFAKLREIADSVGAVLMADIAHFSGLVAGKALKGVYDPVPYAHIISSTTHKTLRGPRGGMVLCQEEFREAVDKGCPYVIGGPLPHVIAAKAVAFKEANTTSFRDYASQVIKNAKAMAEEFNKDGIKLFSGGTDNHLIVIDVHKSFGLNGRHAETALREAKITVNRNTIPFDVNGPWYTSGIRLGTPAMTTLGMKEDEMRLIARLITKLLKATKPKFSEKTQGPSKSQIEIDSKILEMVSGEVTDLLKKHPLYPELSI